jgi:hypothetical protein
MGDWVAPVAKHGSKGCSVWTDDGLIKIADCQSTTLLLGAAQANARLMAASPLLLAVVRRLIDDGVSDALLTDALAAYARATQCST